MTINEVAPPGFGHTKGDKEKGVKKGGTAAAFDKARKEGRFKGSKSDMFAIMWSQKKKGDKPHYKPGTDKKYKKYQEESTMPNVDSKDKKVIKARAKNLFKRDLKGEHQGVNEAVKGQDTDSRKEGAKERATEKRAHDAWKKRPGTKKRPLYSTTKHTKKVGDDYATQQKDSIKWHDDRTKGRYSPGQVSDVDEAVRKRRDVTKSKPKAPQFNAAKELVTDAPYMKPALQQREGTSYKTFMADVQAAKDRLKKKIEDRKKKDAQFVDTKTKGVRFYDKKGKGRIVKGRKVYD